MNPIIPLFLFGNWLASPGEIALLVLLFLLLITVLLFGYLYYKKKQKVVHIKFMKKKYETYIISLNLTEEELSLISKMTRFLESDNQRYHMLTDKRTFAYCASELSKIEKYHRDLKEKIERKLDFPSKKINSSYFSSEDLPTGMPALVLLNEIHKISGSIAENTKSEMKITLKKETSPIREGMRLTVYFHDNQKIFTINTTVLDHSGNTLTIYHSLLQSQKRRAFLRKKVKLPILLTHSDFEEIPMHSYIIDLSEGGASLENPDFNFKKNDRISLFYHVDTEDGFQIKGEVLRLSAKGRIIHARFIDRDLTIRSRIKTIVK